MIAAWDLPAAALPYDPGWLTLDLPLPIETARETVRFEIEGFLTPGSWISFSQAVGSGLDFSYEGGMFALSLFAACSSRLMLLPWWNRSAVGLSPLLWLCPEPQAGVFLPKFIGPVKVVVAVTSAFIPDILEKMQLSLDGGEPSRVKVERRGHRYVLAARLAPDPDSHAGKMRLDIDAVRSESPTACGASNYSYLKVAISRIDLKSV